MSKKIQVIRENLVITDTVLDKVLCDVPKSQYTYDFAKLRDDNIIEFINIDKADDIVFNISPFNFSEAVDFNGDAFTLSSFLNFVRNRLTNNKHIIEKVQHAEDIIFSTYGDIVSVEDKDKDLIKFGINPSVTTAITGHTLWATGVDIPHETYVGANINSIDSISSSDASDTVELVVEGHTEAGGNKTFVVQTVTLTGQTRASLTTPLNRVSRIYNNGSVQLVGNIYVYENTAISAGKPTDVTKIHISIPAGKQQSRKCSTSISSSDYWIITGFTADILTKVASSAEIVLQVRENGKVFREVATVSCSNNHSARFGGDDSPFIIIPKNADVRLSAIGSGNISVSGIISGHLAQII